MSKLKSNYALRFTPGKGYIVCYYGSRKKDIDSDSYSYNRSYDYGMKGFRLNSNERIIRVKYEAGRLMETFSTLGLKDYQYIESREAALRIANIDAVSRGEAFGFMTPLHAKEDHSEDGEEWAQDGVSFGLGVAKVIKGV